jgi:peroxiredoxin
MAISNDDTDVSRKLIADLGLPFPILSDANESLLRRLGMLHEHAKGNGNAARPATYVLDRTGTIMWMRASKLLRTRPDPAEILDAAKAVL